MKTIGAFISILSVIFFIIALIKDGGHITSIIFGGIVDLFVAVIDKIVGDIFSKAVSFIPFVGIFVGFFGKWILSKIINSIFNRKRTSKIKSSYESMTKNSTNPKDWILNFFKSIGKAF